MAETSWPYVSQATTDSEYSWLFRELGQGVVRSSGDTTLQGSADSSGMDSFLDVGRAIMRGYMYRNTATLTLTHDASDAQPRIDLVVLELDITAPDYADRIVAKIIKGTAAATPAEPALTQTDTGIYQMPLYGVNIAASASVIAAGNIYDKRIWIPQRYTEGTTEQRPANPQMNALHYNRTLSRFERWTGSAWAGIDASSVGGRHFFDSTVDPSSGDGVDNDVWYVLEA